MFIAHLPAGYLLTTWLQKKFNSTKFLWLGLLASVFPDVDLIYFYLIDHRQTLHHHYFTHLPLVWLALWLLIALPCIIFKKRTALAITTIIFANIILHFVLDSFVGGIAWLYPFSDYNLFLATVPATHNFWVWSFIFHWTFLVELTIVVWAIMLLFRNISRKNSAKYL
ncbi:TPA: metal-dependent hydrolase [Candidatus Uhrbacteria bacterium]|nr:metal-dependent hydrolase [Candidatus Uhrbacteria bacterium]